mgnify:CR=1 FL=1
MQAFGVLAHGNHQVEALNLKMDVGLGHTRSSAHFRWTAAQLQICSTRPDKVCVYSQP